ncbi:MAG: hypothetical protein MSH15_12945 [Oscillospiraceae bacterium]|nr:hypothetical protein [Oscillospiraceae bacterium]
MKRANNLAPPNDIKTNVSGVPNITPIKYVTEILMHNITENNITGTKYFMFVLFLVKNAE